MSAKSLIVERTAQKQLLRLPLKIHQRIIRSLDQIQNNPLIGSRLGGKLAEFHKLRVGDYRIVYRFNSKESQVEVVKIEHRQGVYK